MKKEGFKWWETTIACNRMQEDGANRQVKEHYLLRANSFTDAEKKSMKVAAETAASDFTIADLKERKYVDVFLSDSADDDNFYQVKVALITLDEKSGKEKKTNLLYLQQASSVVKAINLLDRNLNKEVMCNYVVLEVKQTNILDVFDLDALKD